MSPTAVAGVAAIFLQVATPSSTPDCTIVTLQKLRTGTDNPNDPRKIVPRLHLPPSSHLARRHFTHHAAGLYRHS